MSGTIDIEELREAIRGVLSDRSGGAIDIPGDEGRGLDRALWGEMAGLGWLGMIVPQAHGGLGLGLEHLAVLYEELGRELASVPVLPTMLAAAAIARHAGPETQARWLPALAAGGCLAAFALPRDAPLPLLDARGALAGEVDHLLFADCAGLLALPVRAGEGQMALVLLPTDAAGVTVARRPLVDLTRSAGRVTLDGARVEDGHLLGLAEADWAALLDHAAMALACDAAGGAEALLERTVDYLCMREQFGRPIGSFQALKHRVADWKVRIEAVKVLARHAAALVEAGAADASAMASGAKAHGCDVYAAFAGDAVQLHGGIGFTWEHPCHLFLKRAKLSQQLFGGPAMHRDRVARLAIG
ncbi:alkylation response protein AidB-like acyl-CoA dehydrogenase [Sphingobium jiangsuense]|uniref:Alkylation response protein AidB-like acyl-CoA dehydrogenase n=2 Tax=Sphingobium jiangsuense TaxID=870476 RepID=A0A7W6FQB7_9SPHN|nr:acyl-CoA dehydrogenase family protein [Sphingobium jiangsuense]MBB3925844.1 alkylation response protein AidB-like acyl-CoA dehydrogenase [Sphingobium jiangsuense]